VPGLVAALLGPCALPLAPSRGEGEGGANTAGLNTGRSGSACRVGPTRG